MPKSLANSVSNIDDVEENVESGSDGDDDEEAQEYEMMNNQIANGKGIDHDEEAVLEKSRNTIGIDIGQGMLDWKNDYQFDDFEELEPVKIVKNNNNNNVNLTSRISKNKSKIFQKLSVFSKSFSKPGFSKNKSCEAEESDEEKLKQFEQDGDESRGSNNQGYHE